MRHEVDFFFLCSFLCFSNDFQIEFYKKQNLFIFQLIVLPLSYASLLIVFQSVNTSISCILKSP